MSTLFQLKINGHVRVTWSCCTRTSFCAFVLCVVCCVKLPRNWCTGGGWIVACMAWAPHTTDIPTARASSTSLSLHSSLSTALSLSLSRSPSRLRQTHSQTHICWDLDPGNNVLLYSARCRCRPMYMYRCTVYCALSCSCAGRKANSS
jgi:hypothetical protein